MIAAETAGLYAPNITSAEFQGEIVESFLKAECGYAAGAFFGSSFQSDEDVYSWLGIVPDRSDGCTSGRIVRRIA